jgi:hypothetical protein
MSLYKHTQYAKVILLVVSLGFLLGIVVLIKTEAHPVALATLVLILVCALLFYSLTVEVSGESVRISFGPGLVHETFPLAMIRECRIVKNPWYYGWGIRWTPKGWLFNVAGFHAVEIRMADGKKYRIGTDEPKELLAAIESAREIADGGERRG